MRIADATVFSGFARKTAEQASDFAGVVRNLILDVRDSYRPGVHDMRGPGSEWRARHRAWSWLYSEAGLSPAHIGRRDTAQPIR
jgi:hypothetical protein